MRKFLDYFINTLLALTILVMGLFSSNFVYPWLGFAVFGLVYLLFLLICATAVLTLVRFVVSIAMPVDPTAPPLLGISKPLRYTVLILIALPILFQLGAAIYNNINPPQPSPVPDFKLPLQSSSQDANYPTSLPTPEQGSWQQTWSEGLSSGSENAAP